MFNYVLSSFLRNKWVVWLACLASNSYEMFACTCASRVCVYEAYLFVFVISNEWTTHKEQWRREEREIEVDTKRLEYKHTHTLQKNTTASRYRHTYEQDERRDEFQVVHRLLINCCIVKFFVRLFIVCRLFPLEMYAVCTIRSRWGNSIFEELREWDREYKWEKDTD